jgi:hypothetical protein
MIDIASLRLANQQIAGTKCGSAQEVVGWMGAMQAQDFAMAKWAVGIRFPNSKDSDIEAAINSGKIFRTHVLRPTWHFVSAEDIHWILDLTAPEIKAAMKSRRAELGLSETVFTQSNRIIEKALRDQKQLTREAVIAEFERADFAVDNNRGYHLLVQAELDGILCSGPIEKGKKTYALLEERCPKIRRLSKEEALARLADKYFTSHGPASLQDFIWWSGLPAGDARRALEMVRPGLASETIASRTVWFHDNIFTSRPDENTACFLPAFDEFIISYEDRSASLSDIAFRRAVSSNGIFRPVIVVNGQAIGIWKRAVKQNKVIVETQLFDPSINLPSEIIQNAVSPYGRFLDKEVEIR